MTPMVSATRFSVDPYGKAASPATTLASGQVQTSSAEAQVVSQNLWLRRAVLTLTFFGVGLTAGQVLGLLLPRRRDVEYEVEQ